MEPVETYRGTLAVETGRFVNFLQEYRYPDDQYKDVPDVDIIKDAVLRCSDALRDMKFKDIMSIPDSEKPLSETPPPVGRVVEFDLILYYGDYIYGKYPIEDLIEDARATNLEDLLIGASGNISLARYDGTKMVGVDIDDLDLAISTE